MYRGAPGYASIYGRTLRQPLDITLIHTLGPQNDPAPATKLLALHNPTRGSTTKLLKGLSPWVARHVLGTQPFQPFLCSARQELAPHGVGRMQCRCCRYACTHFDGRDKGFRSSGSFRQCELPGSVPEERASLYSNRQTKRFSTMGPLRSQNRQKENKIKQVP